MSVNGPGTSRTLSDICGFDLEQTQKALMRDAMIGGVARVVFDIRYCGT
jgi:hypothetical protein